MVASAISRNQLDPLSVHSLRYKLRNMIRLRSRDTFPLYRNLELPLQILPTLLFSNVQCDKKIAKGKQRSFV